MAQHDYVISNGTGAAVRSDLNNALLAIVSQNSGATEPTTTYAYQWWADTTTGLLKIRNSANNAWITLRELDGTLTVEDGTVSAPGLAFRDDLNTGIWRPGTDQFAISTNGVERVEWGTSEVVFNDGGTNYDFRVEGDTNANLLFVDASADAVGIGTSSPGSRLTVNRVNFADASATGATTLSNAGITVEAATDTNNRLMFGIGSTGGAPWIQAQNTSSNATQSLILNPVGGNVGIGTTSPSATLHSVGTTILGTGAFPTGSIGLSDARAAILSSTENQILIIGNTNSTVGADKGAEIFLGGKATTGVENLATAKIGGFKSNATSGNFESYLNFSTSNSAGTSSEKARIDSSGRLLVGTSTARSNVNLGGIALTPSVQFEGSGSTYNIGLSLLQYSASGYDPILTLGASQSNTPGTNARVTNGTDLGTINFVGNDGTNFLSGAYIQATIDGSTGTNDLPTRLSFSTTADGASSPTERMRIMNTGSLGFNTTADNVGAGNTNGGISLENAGSDGATLLVSRKTNIPMYVNRNGDGSLIYFNKSGTNEGNINVSGSTVALAGAHLNRYSQIEGINSHDKSVRPEVLRGTVMSNLDKMCEWIDPDSGEAQDNEQLNKTKISDVEGDKNVAGVFQSWDDDDDTWVNDYYLAMTGDFVIRIGAGVTVKRGDLLMSVGDGTAKPQADDLVRSCTVAKVTSTNVSCTYDDGSYCVPCVLMAC